MTNELHTALSTMQEILDREVQKYKSDFIYDISFVISQTQQGNNRFYWFTRDTGTHICLVGDIRLMNLYKEYNDKMYHIDTESGEVQEVWRSEDEV